MKYRDIDSLPPFLRDHVNENCRVWIFHRMYAFKRDLSHPTGWTPDWIVTHVDGDFRNNTLANLCWVPRTGKGLRRRIMVPLQVTAAEEEDNRPLIRT